MRSLIAVTAGGLASLLGYWCGAVVALLALHGIPLGSAGGPPSTADIAAHIALAAIATFGGSRLAMRIARTSVQLHALIVGLVLAIGAILSFGKASSNWPAWFGSAMAAACMLGAVAAARWRRQSRHESGVA